MYRIDIDGLRAIAVISVIVNHFDRSVLPNGHLGVDVFFVISGFVISKSLMSRQMPTFGDYILQFYSRRIKRLAPALFLCVAVTIILVFLITTPGHPSYSYTITGLSALFGLSNLYLFRNSTDYFGSSAELNPFTHTWSLGVEEQFYLVFPVLLWFTGLPSLASKNRGFTIYYIVLGVTSMLSLIAFIWCSTANSSAAFYLMPMRFWEIAMGAIAFSVLQNVHGINNYRAYKSMNFVGLVAMITSVAILFLPYQPSQVVVTIAIVLLTFVIIISVRPHSLVYKFLTVKQLVSIGVISYSLYLWHWSVLAISRLTVGVSLLTIPFQIMTIFILAYISYRYVERPLRRLNWVSTEVRKFQLGEIIFSITLAIGLAVIVFLVIGSKPYKNGRFYTGATAQLVKKGVSTLKDPSNFKENIWRANDCVLSSNDDVGKIISQEICTLGNVGTTSRRILVIGNSFSVAEIEMYKILLEENRGSVTVTSSYGASPVPEIENDTPWDEANDYYWNSVVPKLIDELTAGDVLLMVNDGAGLSPKVHDNVSKEKINLLSNGLTRILEDMSTRGIYVIYQSGIPFMRESGCTPDSSIQQWWDFVKEPPCNYYTRNDSLNRRMIYHEALLQLQQLFDNFAVLDVFDLFCLHGVCKFYNDDGVFVYRDEWSHPSVEGSILAKPVLLKTFDKLLKISYAE